MISGVGSLLRRVRSNQRGTVAVIMAAATLMFVGFGAVIVDVGYMFHVYRVLQASTDAAALAGAMQLGSGSGGTAAITAANTYSGSSGNKNAVANITITATPTTYNCTGYTGASCTATTTNPNAIKVSETATVPLFFARAFGLRTVPISATAYALQAGGKAVNTDIMIIIDTTASMNTADAGCSGATRENCALAGFRTLLQGFTPPTQQVGLMIFPGLKSSTSPTKTAAQNAALEYDCSATTPASGTGSTGAIALYNASPLYTIVGLSSDYKTGSGSSATLNTASNLVKSARGGGSGCTAGITAYGGASTFYADAVTAASSYLTANGRAGANKMIILLSDGAANASSAPNANNECWQGQTAALAAQHAGATVVTIGYGAQSTGCTTDTGATYAGTSYSHNNPCGTLLAMATVGTGSASQPQWFYSDSGSACHGANSATNLNAIFTSISSGITSGGARLIPSS